MTSSSSLAPAVRQSESPAGQPVASSPAADLVRDGVSLWVIVAMSCVAQFMIVLDSVVVLVALPSIRSALHLSVGAEQWVVDGYLITLGGFLLFGARAGDLFGRKRVLLAGIFLFTVMSLIGGLAGSGAVLIAARVVQGLGAAALAPASLSLITASHPEGHARQRALAVWSAASAAGSGGGLVLGGVLTSEVSWRWVLFVNVPVGAVLGLVAARVLLAHRPAGRERRLDLPGAVTITFGVSSLVFGISQVTAHGWGSASVVAPLVVAAVFIAVFGAIEVRVKDPLVPMRVLRRLGSANVIMAILGGLLTTTVYFTSTYQQEGLGLSAVRTGLGVLPMSLVLGNGAMVARRLVGRFGPRVVLIAGGVISAVGLAWLSRWTAHPDYLGHFLPSSLVAAAGLSFMIMPVTVAATTGVPAAQAGLASGLINTSRQIGAALGVAALSTIAESVARSTDATGPVAIVHGDREAMLLLAGCAVLAAAVSLSLPRRRSHV